jgi:hypothetical protein
MEFSAGGAIAHFMSTTPTNLRAARGINCANIRQGFIDLNGGSTAVK